MPWYRPQPFDSLGNTETLNNVTPIESFSTPIGGGVSSVSHTYSFITPSYNATGAITVKGDISNDIANGSSVLIEYQAGGGWITIDHIFLGAGNPGQDFEVTSSAITATLTNVFVRVTVFNTDADFTAVTLYDMVFIATSISLPTTGAISLGDVQTMFGGIVPIGLDEYYRGGGLVPANTPAGSGSFDVEGGPAVQIASSFGSPIKLSQFYGTSSFVPYVYTETVSGAPSGFSFVTYDYNLRNRAMSLLYGSNVSNGTVWDGVSPLIATITIGSSQVIRGSTFTVPAFTTGTGPFPSGSSITITNSGAIVGFGSGVLGYDPPFGTGLELTTNVLLTNYGNIYGGGVQGALGAELFGTNAIVGEAFITYRHVGNIIGTGFVSPWTLTVSPPDIISGITTATATLSSTRFMPLGLTTLPYTITGASAGDVVGGLTGNFIWTSPTDTQDSISLAATGGGVSGLWTIKLNGSALTGLFGLNTPVLPSATLTVQVFSGGGPG